jgi:hypothetical protein
MERYDPLADLLEVAAESCENLGKITKAQMLRNLQSVLYGEPELSRELLRRMAQLIVDDSLKGDALSARYRKRNGHYAVKPEVG